MVTTEHPVRIAAESVVLDGDLVVPEDPPGIVRLNLGAAGPMTAPVQIEIVPGATHLFEEPGKLDAVIDLAVAAPDRHLS